jgi:hypothetical protein
VAWYNAEDVLVQEDGAYGALIDGNGQPVEVTDPATGSPVQVRSILDLDDPELRIYEAHYVFSQEWASQLIDLGYPSGLPLSYDRLTGAVDHTLGALAAAAPGTDAESLHSVLNNTIIKDNRIPTWGMRYDDARVRNALPVPFDQYGDPGPGGVYEHWDDVVLNPPSGSVRADVALLYQTTSWEYIQFLQLANDGSNPFLADLGDDMLEAWIHAGMSEPYTMATATVVPEPGLALSLVGGVALLVALERGRRSPGS